MARPEHRPQIGFRAANFGWEQTRLAAIKGGIQIGSLDAAGKFGLRSLGRFGCLRWRANAQWLASVN